MNNRVKKEKIEVDPDLILYDDRANPTFYRGLGFLLRLLIVVMSAFVVCQFVLLVK